MADTKEAPEPGKNCPACKKILKRKKRYYRNGAYYCNSNCFKKVRSQQETEKKEKQEKEAAPAAKPA